MNKAETARSGEDTRVLYLALELVEGQVEGVEARRLLGGDRRHGRLDLGVASKQCAPDPGGGVKVVAVVVVLAVVAWLLLAMEPPVSRAPSWAAPSMPFCGMMTMNSSPPKRQTMSSRRARVCRNLPSSCSTRCTAM